MVEARAKLAWARPMANFSRGRMTMLFAHLLRRVPVGLILLTGFLHALALPAPAGTLAPPGAGSIHAIVIGIDAYQQPKIPKLKGAVADARDIAESLKTHGVDDITLLTDAVATRAGIVGVLERLHATTGPGDLVVLSFAGHGMQQPEPSGRHAEADRKDEVWLFAGFNWVGAGRAERMIDNELFVHLKQFAEKGVQVLVLADSCYGGGMAKSIDPRGGSLSVRGLPADTEAIDTAGDPAPNPPEGSDEAAIVALSGVTFIGGTEEERTVPEVRIDGRKRGAASYAFARTLEGWADADHDGTTTRSELLAYLRPEVSQLSGSLQWPVLLPRLGKALAAPVFRNPAPPSGGLTGAVAPAVSPLSFAITISRGIGAGDAAGGQAQLEAVDPESGEAELKQDAATGDVLDGSNTVIAYGVGPGGIAGVADRTAAVKQLALLAQGRGIPVELDPRKDLYTQGEGIHVVASGVAGYYVQVVDIAGSGEVQYVPFDDPLAAGDAVAMPVHVQPPYGSDTLIVVATPERDRALEDALRALDRQVKPVELVKALQERLTRAEDRIGFVVVRTRDK